MPPRPTFCYAKRPASVTAGRLEEIPGTDMTILSRERLRYSRNSKVNAVFPWRPIKEKYVSYADICKNMYTTYMHNADIKMSYKSVTFLLAIAFVFSIFSDLWHTSFVNKPWFHDIFMNVESNLWSVSI